MHLPHFAFPSLGFGVGLRACHFQEVLRLLDDPSGPGVDWFEIVSENFLDTQGWPRYVLDRVRERYPLVMHGVSLSIGSSDPMDFTYLAKLKKLADSLQASWVSDHLCWTGVQGQTTHDLLPMPLTEESLRHVVARIQIVQDFLERPLILENPSSYLAFTCDSLRESEFLKILAEEADCGLLLDVNNVYVSAFNHHFDAHSYLMEIPPDRVVQFHIAGHRHHQTHIIDTHDGPVSEPVWELYREASRRSPYASTLLEWDANLPEFSILVDEVNRARTHCSMVGTEL